jgi:hypothetical protein
MYLTKLIDDLNASNPEFFGSYIAIAIDWFIALNRLSTSVLKAAF